MLCSGLGRTKTVPPLILVLIVLVALWISIFTLVSSLGGWALLARWYGNSDEFSGDRWRFQNGQMRWYIGYNHCLTFGANAQGLYLSILLPFRIAHPPLLVPWKDISVIPKKVLGFNIVELRLGRDLSIPLRIGPRLAQRLKESAGLSWPHETSAKG